MNRSTSDDDVEPGFSPWTLRVLAALGVLVGVSYIVTDRFWSGVFFILMSVVGVSEHEITQRRRSRLPAAERRPRREQAVRQSGFFFVVMLALFVLQVVRVVSSGDDPAASVVWVGLLGIGAVTIVALVRLVSAVRSRTQGDAQR